MNGFARQEGGNSNFKTMRWHARIAHEYLGPGPGVAVPLHLKFKRLFVHCLTGKLHPRQGGGVGARRLWVATHTLHDGRQLRRALLATILTAFFTPDQRAFVFIWSPLRHEQKLHVTPFAVWIVQILFYPIQGVFKRTSLDQLLQPIKLIYLYPISKNHSQGAQIDNGGIEISR